MQRLCTMDVMECSSEVSGNHKTINGVTVFYCFPYDVETALRKGLNAICVLADIGQRTIRELHDSDNTKLNVEANEYALMKRRECVEDAHEKLKTNKGWVKPTKHVPITCFFKNNNNSENDENLNNNRHNVFKDDTDVYTKQEKHEVGMTLNGKK